MDQGEGENSTDNQTSYENESKLNDLNDEKPTNEEEETIRAEDY